MNLADNPKARVLCRLCGKKFKPTSRNHKLCDKCYHKRWREALEKFYGKKMNTREVI